MVLVDLRSPTAVELARFMQNSQRGDMTVVCGADFSQEFCRSRGRGSAHGKAPWRRSQTRARQCQPSSAFGQSTAAVRTVFAVVPHTDASFRRYVEQLSKFPALTQAANKFDPDFGTRFATYAQYSLEALGAERHGAADPLLFARGPSPEQAVVDRCEARRTQQAVQCALATLSARERRIVQCRLMAEPDAIATFEQLSVEFGVSRERVRQLEVRIKQKLAEHLLPFRVGGGGVELDSAA